MKKMKGLKKILMLALAVVMCCGASINAMAADRKKILYIRRYLM